MASRAMADSRIPATSPSIREATPAEGNADGSRRRQDAGSREITLAPTAHPGGTAFFPAATPGSRVCICSARWPAKKIWPTMPSPPAGRDRRQAPHPLRRGRTAMGVQVHPAGRRRRQDRAGCLHAAHHREQDLPPGHQRSQGTGEWLSRRARKISSPTRASSWARSRPATSPLAAGIAARVRGPPRRRVALPWRPLRAWGWRMGRVEPGRFAAHLSSQQQEHVSPRSGNGRTHGGGVG